MFAASETGNHALYKFSSLGEESEDAVETKNIMSINMDGDDSKEVYFWPRKLMNLNKLEEWENMACIADTKVDDLLNEGCNQIYNLCAAGDR